MYTVVVLCLCLITFVVGGQDQNFFRFDSLSPPLTLCRPPSSYEFHRLLPPWPQAIHFPKIAEPREIKLPPPAAASPGIPPMVEPRPPVLAGKSAHLKTIIKRCADRYGLEERLVVALISHESGFDAAAVSSEGAKGLMQLMPETAARLGVNNALDPQQNIAGGVKYLKMCLDRFDQDVVLALAAYNAGPGNVEKYNGCPPFRETRKFVASVMEKCYGQDWREKRRKTSS